MLGLSFKVCNLFGLVASVALCAALEVVVLALATHPATIREVEVIFVRSGVGGGVQDVSSPLLLSLSFLLLLLILAPLGGSSVESISVLLLDLVVLATRILLGRSSS